MLLGWLALSTGLALWALIGTGKLLRRRRSWEAGSLLGQPVLWSRDTGPAIVGLFRPSVVLPSWVADVEVSKQKLILAHEEEHRRAGDGILRLAAAALLVAFPWNPFLWLHYRRLCLAIELDCDHRVMQRLPDRRWLYGDLLVRVGGRGGMRPGFAPTAFAERRSFLERRIGKLLSDAPEVGMARVAFLGFAAILAVGLAMWVPGVTEEAVQPAEAGAFKVDVPTSTSDWVSTFEFQLDVDGSFNFQHSIASIQLPMGYGRINQVARVEAAPSEMFEIEPVAPLPFVPFPFRNADQVLEQARCVEPPRPGRAISPQYVFHTAAPELLNGEDVNAALQREYSTKLKDVGVGGTVVVQLFVHTDGTVITSAVKDYGPGHTALYYAALRVASVARFRPAQCEGTIVGM